MEFLKKVKHKTRIRTRYRDAKRRLKAVGYIYRTSGVEGVNHYIKEGVKKRINKEQDSNYAADILFVTIDNAMLNHYRVDHMIETLESAGKTVSVIPYYALNLDHIRRYNVFIFYRSPWVPQYKEIFEEIKKKNKISIYAVDDLVIDRKYTDDLPVVKELLPEDRKVYDDGVERHKKLMTHCDYAITTTNDLKKELLKYKNLKTVYVDRNMRNDETIYHSQKAIKEVKRDDSKVIIGYFSGTNTHNEDFKLIASALVKILKRHKNVYIKLTGQIETPTELKGFDDRIIFTPLVTWQRLPYEMRECDITVAPLVDTIFNRGKSELKWADSSLVEVPVVASNIGASKDVVKDGETGVLVANTDEAWFDGLEKLVTNKKLRVEIGRQAREYVKNNYCTTGKNAMNLVKFIDKITPPVITFAGINIGAISGGNLVVQKHMDILQNAGNIVYGVESMSYSKNDQWKDTNQQLDEKHDIFRVNSKASMHSVSLKMHFDRYVATFWSSVDMVDSYKYMNKDGEKLYLVQGMEADFYKGSDHQRRSVFATYNNYRVTPITISKWCQEWLESDFGRNAKYAENGIDLNNFKFKKRNFKNRKVRVLIEGDSSSDYKRVDESFKIANKLDPEKYEISYLSYNGEPKNWYRVDNTYIKVPYEEVGKIYQKNDILLKSSILESFSYPPIEMMATGGVSVLVENGGNAEYIKDGENALYYKTGNVEDALDKINKLVNSQELFNNIANNGRKTAESREWDRVAKNVQELYK